jgi:hypothetical protein
VGVVRVRSGFWVIRCIVIWLVVIVRGKDKMVKEGTYGFTGTKEAIITIIEENYQSKEILSVIICNESKDENIIQFKNSKKKSLET